MNNKVKTIYHCLMGSQDIEGGLKSLRLLARTALDELIARSYTDNILTKNWCVYMLELRDGSLYTGIAKNLRRRLEAHELGRGSKYVRSRLPFTLIYVEVVQDRSEASKIEYQIKQMPKSKKVQVGMMQKAGTQIYFCEPCNINFRVRDEDVESIPDLSCPTCGSPHYKELLMS